MRAFRIITQKMRSMARYYASLERPIKLYALEGLLISLAVTLIINNNNLFATRLGANDFHLGLVSMLPQFVNMLALIPGAVITDSFKSKRKMVIVSIGLTGMIYLAIGFVPLLRSMRLAAFIALLSLSGGAMTLYNLSWQSFFPDVIPISKRNKTITVRTSIAVFIGVLAPLITGNILSRLNTDELKIMAHQGFFFSGAVLIAIQIMVLMRMNPVSQPVSAGHGFGELKKACVSLIHNKAFMFYACVAWFFYLTWQMDWTMGFIGQTQYLKMNEAQLGYVIVTSTLAQFLTLQFWSRMNERKGVVFTMTYGLFGLCLNPLAMIAATLLPASVNIPLFILFCALTNLTFATILLNPFQCLLEVLDEKYRTLSISLFSVLVCLSNAVMPFAGVMLYRFLGANLSGLQGMYLIVFVLRLCAAGLWLFRWKLMARN